VKESWQPAENRISCPPGEKEDEKSWERVAGGIYNTFMEPSVIQAFFQQGAGRAAIPGTTRATDAGRVRA